MGNSVKKELAKTKECENGRADHLKRGSNEKEIKAGNKKIYEEKKNVEKNISEKTSEVEIQDAEKNRSEKKGADDTSSIIVNIYDCENYFKSFFNMNNNNNNNNNSTNNSPEINEATGECCNDASHEEEETENHILFSDNSNESIIRETTANKIHIDTMFMKNNKYIIEYMNDKIDTKIEIGNFISFYYFFLYIKKKFLNSQDNCLMENDLSNINYVYNEIKQSTNYIAADDKSVCIRNYLYHLDKKKYFISEKLDDINECEEAYKMGYSLQKYFSKRREELWKQITEKNPSLDKEKMKYHKMKKKKSLFQCGLKPFRSLRSKAPKYFHKQNKNSERKSNSCCTLYELKGISRKDINPEKSEDIQATEKKAKKGGKKKLLLFEKNKKEVHIDSDHHYTKENVLSCKESSKSRPTSNRYDVCEHKKKKTQDDNILHSPNKKSDLDNKEVPYENEPSQKKINEKEVTEKEKEKMDSEDDKRNNSKRSKSENERGEENEKEKENKQEKEKKKETEKEKHKMSIGISFSPAGLLIPYHLGVSSLLIEKNIFNLHTSIAGSSAGSICACCLGIGLNIDRCFFLVENIISNVYKNGCYQKLEDMLKKELQKYLYVGSYEFLNNRIGNVFVGITQIFPYYKKLNINKFYNDKDLISAIIASCNIPMYLSNNIFVNFRNKKCIDGFFSTRKKNFGCPDTKTPRAIKVSPFDSDFVGIENKKNSVISPHLIKYNHLIFLFISVKNLCTLCIDQILIKKDLRFLLYNLQHILNRKIFDMYSFFKAYFGFLHKEYTNVSDDFDEGYSVTASHSVSSIRYGKNSKKQIQKIDQDKKNAAEELSNIFLEKLVQRLSQYQCLHINKTEIKTFSDICRAVFSEFDRFNYSSYFYDFSNTLINLVEYYFDENFYSNKIENVIMNILKENEDIMHRNQYNYFTKSEFTHFCNMKCEEIFKILKKKKLLEIRNYIYFYPKLKSEIIFFFYRSIFSDELLSKINTHFLNGNINIMIEVLIKIFLNENIRKTIRRVVKATYILNNVSSLEGCKSGGSPSEENVGMYFLSEETIKDYEFLNKRLPFPESENDKRIEKEENEEKDENEETEEKEEKEENEETKGETEDSPIKDDNMDKCNECMKPITHYLQYSYIYKNFIYILEEIKNGNGKITKIDRYSYYNFMNLNVDDINDGYIFLYVYLYSFLYYRSVNCFINVEYIDRNSKALYANNLLCKFESNDSNFFQQDYYSCKTSLKEQEIFLSVEEIYGLGEVEKCSHTSKLKGDETLSNKSEKKNNNKSPLEVSNENTFKGVHLIHNNENREESADNKKIKNDNRLKEKDMTDTTSTNENITICGIDTMPFSNTCSSLRPISGLQNAPKFKYRGNKGNENLKKDTYQNHNSNNFMSFSEIGEQFLIFNFDGEVIENINFFYETQKEKIKQLNKNRKQEILMNVCELYKLYSDILFLMTFVFSLNFNHKTDYNFFTKKKTKKRKKRKKRQVYYNDMCDPFRSTKSNIETKWSHAFNKNLSRKYNRKENESFAANGDSGNDKDAFYRKTSGETSEEINREVNNKTFQEVSKNEIQKKSRDVSIKRSKKISPQMSKEMDEAESPHAINFHQQKGNLESHKIGKLEKRETHEEERKKERNILDRTTPNDGDTPEIRKRNNLKRDICENEKKRKEKGREKKEKEREREKEKEKEKKKKDIKDSKESFSFFPKSKEKKDKIYKKMMTHSENVFVDGIKTNISKFLFNNDKTYFVKNDFTMRQLFKIALEGSEEQIIKKIYDLGRSDTYLWLFNEYINVGMFVFKKIYFLYLKMISSFESLIHLTDLSKKKSKKNVMNSQNVNGTVLIYVGSNQAFNVFQFCNFLIIYNSYCNIKKYGMLKSSAYTDFYESTKKISKNVRTEEMKKENTTNLSFSPNHLFHSHTKKSSSNRSISLPLELRKTVLKSNKLKRKIDINKNIVTAIENGILNDTPYEHIYTHSNFWLHSSDEETDEENICYDSCSEMDVNTDKGFDYMLENSLFPMSGFKEFDNIAKISNLFKTFKYMDPHFKFFGYFGF